MYLEDHVLQRDAVELEDEDWIKIYENPINMRVHYISEYGEKLPQYDYLGAHYPTPQQKEVLLKKGLKLHDYRW